MAATKTPKELAEATAAAALESLQATLRVEVELRAKLRDACDVSAVKTQLERQVLDAEKRTNAAFSAWRAAQDAVPSDRSDT